jgi:hypothetical protein
VTKYATRAYLDALKKIVNKDSGRVGVTQVSRLVCGEVHEGPPEQLPPVRIIFPKATRV